MRCKLLTEIKIPCARVYKNKYAFQQCERKSFKRFVGLAIFMLSRDFTVHGITNVEILFYLQHYLISDYLSCETNFSKQLFGCYNCTSGVWLSHAHLHMYVHVWVHLTYLVTRLGSLLFLFYIMSMLNICMHMEYYKLSKKERCRRVTRY